MTGLRMGIRTVSIAAATALLFLSGCATMSADECATSDWHAIGYEDGARGYTMDKLGQRRKACAKHGVTPDFRAYRAGRDDGLLEFCQPSKGYNLGVSGSRYNGVCDAALEEEFLDAYRVGNQLYTLRANVNSASNRIYRKQSELDEIDQVTREKETLLISDKTNTEERLLLLGDLKDLSERKGELEAEVEALIAERAHHEHELSSYERTVAAYGF